MAIVRISIFFTGGEENYSGISMQRAAVRPVVEDGKSCHFNILPRLAAISTDLIRKWK